MSENTSAAQQMHHLWNWPCIWQDRTKKLKSSFTSNLPEVPLCFLTVKDLYPSDCQSWRVNSDSAVSLEPLQGPWKAEAPWGKWLAVLSLLFLGPTQIVVSSTGLLKFDFVSAELWYVSLDVYFPQYIVLPCNI
jgi:hypothetical protein